MDCDICCDNFDDKEKEPKILVRCGHTLCAGCVESIRRTSGNDIVCPHCRVVTRVDEIRTNFAVRNLLEQSPPAKNPERPFCDTHATNQVSVYCVPCSQFVCPECFETSDSVHGTHARVSFTDGISKVRQELDGMTQSCERIKESNTKDLQQLHLLHQELSRLNDICVGHFNRIVEGFKSQLAQVQARIHKSGDRLQAQSAVAVNKLNTAKAIVQLVTRIKGDISTHLVDYTRNRAEMKRYITSMTSDVGRLEDEFDQVSISRSGGPDGKTHGDIPRISLCFPDSYEIFRFEGCTSDGAIPNEERIKRRTLHRKTSNDELKD